MSAQQRLTVYRVAAAILPLLVAYGLLSSDQAPLWLALAAAVLSIGPPALAARNITPDDDGS